MSEMTDKEKFLFGLQGFLVVKDFLTQEEVRALNEAFDANWDKQIDRSAAGGVGTALYL